MSKNKHTALKLWWTTQSARIDALSLRERVFLFLSVIACALALVDTVWLSPAKIEHKQLKQRLDKQNEQLQSLRISLMTSKPPVNPNIAPRDELAQAQAQLQALEADVQATSGTASGSTPLAQTLAQFLKHHDGLTLVRTAALPLELPAAPAGQATSQTGGQGAAKMAAVAGLTRQGLELTVAGPYAELTRFVQSLEKALPNRKIIVMVYLLLAVVAAGFCFAGITNVPAGNANNCVMISASNK